jgi:hypothetical protein
MWRPTLLVWLEHRRGRREGPTRCLPSRLLRCGIVVVAFAFCGSVLLPTKISTGVRSGLFDLSGQRCRLLLRSTFAALRYSSVACGHGRRLIPCQEIIRALAAITCSRTWSPIRWLRSRLSCKAWGLCRSEPPRAPGPDSRLRLRCGLRDLIALGALRFLAHHLLPPPNLLSATEQLSAADTLAQCPIVPDPIRVVHEENHRPGRLLA